MQLVEQHCIKRNDPRYAVIDVAAFASKNLYNAALYEVRQAYIKRGYRLYYPELYHLLKSHEAYRALPAKVAQQVLKLRLIVKVRGISPNFHILSKAEVTWNPVKISHRIEG